MVSDTVVVASGATHLSVMVFPLIVMSETVTSEEIEPMDIPCPPMQVLRWKTMLLPLLIARQSSWLWMVLRRILSILDVNE